MKAVLASKNAHKLKEIEKIVSAFGMELVLQSELGIDIDVEETGTTFEENSMLKARAVMEAAGMPAIADDSGLMVDALGGEPGVYSARYGGDRCKNDIERYEYLLANLHDVPDGKRGAKFVSVITLVYPDGHALIARGEVAGEILREARGENGFGYDPVFYIPGDGKTMAEIPPERKNEISHRANALQELARLLGKE
ncbi:MAG: XTP/dITP diphosphatase [Oscillospiraceae bacterium]|nr:XTP/dITP diphosphatase [Oscillospiraceae bacterium]